MIQVQNKQYQIALWVTEDRSGDEPGLRLEFDELGEAQAAFKAHQTAGVYKSGILMEWQKQGGAWFLLERFPDWAPQSN